MSEAQTTAVGSAPQVTPDAIMQLGFAFWGSKALLSAVELGVFSELADAGTLDGEALRERLGLHPRSATDFFDSLVALGMLEREDGRYANTPATDMFLDRGKPSYVGGILEMANARLYEFWGSLTEGLRTGAPQNEGKHGGDFLPSAAAQRRRSQQSFPGAITAAWSTLGVPKVRCRFRSPWRTTTLRVVVSTCPRSSRSSTPTSPAWGWASG